MISNNKIHFHTDRGLVSINLDNIIHIEALSNYSKLYLNKFIHFENGKLSNSKTMVVSKVLKWFENELITNGFVRINRSNLINKDLITNKNSFQVQINNSKWLTISRRRRKCVIIN